MGAAYRPHVIGGPSYHLRATPLPGGERPVDFQVAGGRLTFAPQDGAVELAPEGGYVLPGLVDAHVHATIAGRQEHHLPIGSRELTDANRRRGPGSAPPTEDLDDQWARR